MLLVTTTRRSSDEQVARAVEVARLCGARFAARDGSVARMLAAHGADTCYLVGRDREEVRGHGLTLFLHPGTYHMVAHLGREGDPLLRAIAPLGEPAPTRVIDATLGVAGNALQIAGLLGARVIGLEASAPLACLAEAGLARLAAAGRRYSPGAGRIRVVQTRAARWLEDQAPGSAEAVYLDPMFAQPGSAEPGFGLVRHLARGEPLDADTYLAAARVAARRVVLRVPACGQAPPEAAVLTWHRRVRGKALDYLVHEPPASGLTTST